LNDKENVLKDYTLVINGYIVSGIAVFLTGVATSRITTVGVTVYTVFQPSHFQDRKSVDTE
jgi:hypothetical protein